LPERVAHDRNKTRSDRDFGPHVIRQQAQQLHRSLRGLEREGFRHVYVLKSVADIDAVVIERQPLWNNLKHEHGPFDIIGDVHGCFEELLELLGKLGYEMATEADQLPLPAATGDIGGNSSPWLRHPQGRKLIFLGDLVDRGPGISPADSAQVSEPTSAQVSEPTSAQVSDPFEESGR
jgi:protein phosphatase